MMVGLVMILALMVIGGTNIRDFLTAMLIGMISGGYSSIFVATPLMLWLSRGQLKAEDSVSPMEAALSRPMDLDAQSVDSDSTVAEMVKEKKEKKKKTAKKQRRR